MKKVYNLKEIYNQGHRRICLKCFNVVRPAVLRFIYDSTKQEWLYNGGGKEINVCQCGGNLGYLIQGKSGRIYICQEPRLDTAVAVAVA